MDRSEQIRADLIRYTEEYHWNPRTVSKLLNLRHGTDYSAKDINALYGKLRVQKPIQSSS